MEHKLTVTITSLISIVLFELHWAYEVTNGWETGGVQGLGGIAILLVWLYGTLVLREGRSGYIIMLIGGNAEGLFFSSRLRCGSIRFDGSIL